MVKLFILAMIVSVVDIIYGSINAFVRGKFVSSEFKTGIVNHLFAILVLALTLYFSDTLVFMGVSLDNVVVPLVIAYIVAEFISMLETYKESGGTLPDSLDKYINKKK